MLASTLAAAVTAANEAGNVIDRQADRSRTLVRRHSFTAGRCEGTFWRRTGRQEVSRIVLAARRYELTGRMKGGRSGPLGHVAIEVLELFAHLVNYRTGQLDPSLDYLMRTLKRSRDAIVRALRALRDHGFLDWLRRYVPTGAKGGGPQVQQTSNAYRLSLPARAARLLARYGQTPPPPDDHRHGQAEQAAVLDAHLATLSTTERTLFTIADDALAASLRRLGALMEERESARQAESRSKILTKGE